MKRCYLTFLLVLGALAAAFAQNTVSNSATALPPDTLQAFQARLKTHIEHPRFAEAQWGIKVVSLDTGKILFQNNADKLMKPASNTKMYTCALALDRLGPDYRIKTSFYAESKPDADGTLKGDLIVYGRGDPSFSWRFNNGDYVKGFEPVINAVAAAGIKKIEGNLIGDDSYFRGSPFGTDWAVDDLQCWYGAPASALSLQDNVIDLVFKPGAKVGDPLEIITKPQTTFMAFSNRTETGRTNSQPRVEIYRPVGENTTYVWGRLPMDGKNATDSVAVHTPALWFVSMLKEGLAQRGIAVSGSVRAVNWLDREVKPIDCSKLVEVASLESRPMAEIVKETMKPSQNLYAHLLLLQVGAKTKDPARAKTQWTESAGLAEMNRFLAQIGIKKNTVLLEEGSGLSRGCLLTPSASVSLLTYMSRHRNSAAFVDALPLAGVDGTLKGRFSGTAAEKNVRAKTGSLGHVNTISGYVTTRGNEKLVFSVMLNNYKDSDGHPGRAESDAVVQMLAEFTGR